MTKQERTHYRQQQLDVFQGVYSKLNLAAQ